MNHTDPTAHPYLIDVQLVFAHWWKSRAAKESTPQLRFLEHRIGDKLVLRLVECGYQWVKKLKLEGVLPLRVCPQGSVISPRFIERLFTLCAGSLGPAIAWYTPNR